jgi:2'-5' RNA ligase
MPEAGPIRAFLAIPRDAAWSDSARRLVEELRPTSPAASWTRPSAWHLTLKFLGTAARETLDAFGAAITPVAAAVVPGELRPAGAAVFPENGPARVLAIELAASETLSGVDRLVAAAEEEARRLGLEREDRPFRLHVTLARVRARWPQDAVERFREAAGRWPFPEWQARSCVLYESRLEPSGAVHTPIAEWSFAGGPRGVTA